MLRRKISWPFINFENVVTYSTPARVLNSAEPKKKMKERKKTTTPLRKPNTHTGRRDGKLGRVKVRTIII